MTRNKKKRNLEQKEILQQKVRETFRAISGENSYAHISLARQNFEDLIDNGAVSVSDGFKIINDPKSIAKVLKVAEASFDKWIDEMVKQRENARIMDIHKSTRNKAVILTGVIAGTIVGTMFCLLSPFVNAWLQPTADELFKRASKKAEAPKPVFEEKSPVVPVAKKYASSAEPFSHPR